jgi:hypothetical protein
VVGWGWRWNLGGESRNMAKQAPSKPKGNAGSPAKQVPSSLRAEAESWTPAQQAPSKPKVWGPPAGLTNKEQNNLNADRLLKEVMNEGRKRSNQRKSRKSRKLTKTRKTRKYFKRHA